MCATAAIFISETGYKKHALADLSLLVRAAARGVCTIRVSGTCFRNLRRHPDKIPASFPLDHLSKHFSNQNHL
jgi:hypothetical protein